MLHLICSICINERLRLRNLDGYAVCQPFEIVAYLNIELDGLKYKRSAFLQVALLTYLYPFNSPSMKTFTIAVSLAFLGACHSVHGTSQIGDTLQNGICPSVEGLGVCPPTTSLPCSYETIRTKNREFSMYMRVSFDVISVACHLSYFPFFTRPHYQTSMCFS